MQTPEYVGSSAARMIVALTAFFGLVAAGVWWLALAPEPEAASTAAAESPDSDKKTKDLRPSQAADGPFFYTAIGTTQTTEAVPVAPRPNPKLTYTLEIKVTKSKAEAEKLIDDLSAHGIEAYYTPLSRQGQVVYRVRRGVFPSQKAASRASLALKEQHQIATRVVKLQ